MGTAARPYIKFEHERVSDTSDRVHMAFTDGHPRDVPTNAIYYACLVAEHLLKGFFIDIYAKSKTASVLSGFARSPVSWNLCSFFFFADN